MFVSYFSTLFESSIFVGFEISNLFFFLISLFSLHSLNFTFSFHPFTVYEIDCISSHLSKHILWMFSKSVLANAITSGFLPPFFLSLTHCFFILALADNSKRERERESERERERERCPIEGIKFVFIDTSFFLLLLFSLLGMTHF